MPVSSSDTPRGRLDSAKVHHIRTAAVIDSHLARLYRVTAAAIRDARVGDTWPDHPTPPDKSRRSSWGRRGSPKARDRQRTVLRMISHERLDHPANYALQAREVSQEGIYAGQLS